MILNLHKGILGLLALKIEITKSEKKQKGFILILLWINSDSMLVNIVLNMPRFTLSLFFQLEYISERTTKAS